MTHLKTGAQYAVYDLGNGRVKKIPTTLEAAMELQKSWGASVQEQTQEHSERLLTDAQKAITIVQKSGMPLQSIGNPIFNADGSYEQDLAVPLRAILENCDDNTAHDLFEQFLSHIFLQWRHGFSERTYNFSENYGLVKGKLILLDFGELTEDKVYILDHISRHRWHQAYSYKWLSENRKQQFDDTVAQHLTTTMLESLWHTTA